MDHRKLRTSNRVATDGQFKFQYYESPSQLANYCSKLKNAFSEDNGRRKVRPCRKSSVCLDANLAVEPRLNIAIHIVGSRGDVQPFIPIAQLLMKPPYNHRVRVCTHPAFKDFVESNGIEFFSIGGDPEALMAYMVKNPGLLPGRESVKAGDIGQRRKEMAEIIDAAWRSCIEAGNGMGQRVTAANVDAVNDLFLADAIIANPPSMAHIHIAEKLGIPLHLVFTMPWSPTKSFHHPLTSISSGEADVSVTNYLSFMMMEYITWQGLGDIINKFRVQTLHLDSVSPMWGHQIIPRLRVPYTYLWSEALIPKPPDWDSHIQITGFSFLPLASSYTPPPDLTAFLEKGDTPVYVGFGSIVVDDPNALTNLVFEALKLANVRGIVAKGWGGVGVSDLAGREDIYLIGNCPHDWLFQRVSCVVHHGGAGTTAAGIANSKPTVIVPFFGDQPFWGQMVAKAGAGPKPVPYKQITAQGLADSIRFALKPEVRTAVEDMARTIEKENGALDTVVDIQKRLHLDGMRCDLCPERIAHWKHKQTGAFLSSFAVACLVREGHYHPHDFKLLRHKNWYVGEGAEHPLIGAVGAFTGFFTELATATKDYAHRVKNPPKRRPYRDGSTSSEQNTFRFPGPGQLTPSHRQHLAMKMVKKKLRRGDETRPDDYRPTLHDKHKELWKAHEKDPTYGRVYYTTRATCRYGLDITEACLGLPVAFFFNIANGFHNFPSYGSSFEEVRKRDEITGFGSGCRVAGKEFCMGIWDAFAGIGLKPYKGAKAEGSKGFAKGLFWSGAGVVDNLGAAIFGLPGYTLKGIEKELAKHKVTKLMAELVLIRLREADQQARDSTAEEREEVLRRWKSLHGSS